VSPIKTRRLLLELLKFLEYRRIVSPILLVSRSATRYSVLIYQRSRGRRKNIALEYVDDTHHHQNSSNYQSSLFIHLQSWHYIIITPIQLARMSRGTLVFDGGVMHTGCTFHEPLVPPDKTLSSAASLYTNESTCLIIDLTLHSLDRDVPGGFHPPEHP